MNNFHLRLISTLIITPVFVLFLYKGGFFLYSLMLFLLLASFYEIFTNVKQKKLSIILYTIIIFFLFSLFKVRGVNYESFILLLWILSIVSMSDIFGYLIGNIIGGPKLCKYSPNKTIAGFLGSVFFSQISVLIPLFFLDNFAINLSLVFLQFFLCLISIIGDIFFSYIKRINKIKDYSALIPGHGGVLDRIDGMIFVIILYYIILLINEF